MREGLDKRLLRGVYDRLAKRYDLQHTVLTARSDGRGRKMIVERTVRPGDVVLDCGAGTGSTGLLAAKRVGSSGKVVLLDMSEGMLAVARGKAETAGVENRLEFHVGDILHLPFDEASFDVVLSTYSMCPLYDPAEGAREVYRVLKPGGRAGFAHSADPRNVFLRLLAGWVEGLAWRFPSISMGCRSVSVLPALQEAGACLTFRRYIGVPLWPFLVFVVEKPIMIPQ